jgi:hypothetical protein
MTYYFRVPVTPALREFIDRAIKAEGHLSGGFQGLVRKIVGNVDGDGLHLDDEILGRAWRYANGFRVAGGWQDTHLPTFLREVARLLKVDEKTEERGPFQPGLF